MAATPDHSLQLARDNWPSAQKTEAMPKDQECQATPQLLSRENLQKRKDKEDSLPHILLAPRGSFQAKETKVS